MKIYIITDMEGISGICNEAQVKREMPQYVEGQRLLSGDVNAAIAGAFEGGATEVLVSDAHGSGFNFILEQMDPHATYERPNGGLDFMPGLDDSFDGLFCIGYHAMAGTLNGFLDHTQSSASWFNYWVNGRRTGELGQCGLWAGSYGVPMLLVTGDRAACDEAHDFFGEIETVSVKQGIGRQYARCTHPEATRISIREAARRSLSLIGKARPYRVQEPLTLRLEFYRSDMADSVALRPGTRRINARTVERVVDNPRLLLSI
ncbi:MAG: D-amino peptidase [Abditibacteriota bacterium]|nr:D-amino peptidase [Abditibacteriota bacterium]